MLNALFALTLATTVCVILADPQVNDTDLPEDVKANMLDDSDPQVRAELLCSACHWSVVELHDTFVKLKGGEIKRPRQDMIDDALDEMCVEKSKLYGLSVPQTTKKARARFTRLKSRVDGAWITTMWLNECNEMLQRLSQQGFSNRGWGKFKSLFGDEASTGPYYQKGPGEDVKEQMKVDKFLQLCPMCKGEGMEKVFHPRSTSRMWMSLKEQMTEDWELSPDL